MDVDATYFNLYKIHDMWFDEKDETIDPINCFL